MTSRVVPQRIVICAVLAMFAACSGSEATAPPHTVVAVRLFAPDTAVEVGSELSLFTTALDSAARVIHGASVGWTSRDTTVATVVAGTVLGVRPGTTVVVASASASAGDSVRIRVFPLPRTYDFTATFKTFSFETAGPSPPDCTNPFSMYCYHTRPFTGGSLTGTLLFRKNRATATLAGSFCDTWSVDAPAGCTHVAPLNSPAYVTDHLYATEVNPSGPGYLFLRAGGVEFLPYVVLDGQFAPDSIYGNIYWGKYAGRGPPAHAGTFVAHRR